MPSYNWRDFLNQPWNQRFPTWARGYQNWARYFESPTWQDIDLGHRGPTPQRPRLFVSHKQVDKDKARRIAWLADQEGFEYWLDVLDPQLQSLQQRFSQLSEMQKALVTAAIIEMGLLNSTHIMVVVTEETHASRWVPYEYGRVKDPSMLAEQAACWVAQSERRRLSEYFHLGDISFAEADIHTWLGKEFSDWVREHGPCGKPAGQWSNAEPTPDLDTT